MDVALACFDEWRYAFGRPFPTTLVLVTVIRREFQFDNCYNILHDCKAG